MKKIILLAIIASLSTSLYARQGKSVRCHSGLVMIDDYLYEVNQKCGEPLQVYDVNGSDDIKVEQALYKIKGKLYNLTYEGGKLIKIEFA
ncbi:DUF2845 domain-containing protein [Psychromonas sp.]|uniref:DUF2845 domain-containing protein n=1 Tax=Psychromonas sp. TaxID=1884585 RepID=UPI003A969D4A